MVGITLSSAALPMKDRRPNSMDMQLLLCALVLLILSQYPAGTEPCVKLVNHACCGRAGIAHSKAMPAFFIGV
jgi:hypothetical protein